MRFLLDEMFSRRVTEELGAAGIVATHVSDEGLGATDDEIILALACANGLVLVSTNLRDLRPLHADRIARGQVVGPLLLTTPATLSELGAAQPAEVAALIVGWARDHPAPYPGEHWLR